METAGTLPPFLFGFQFVRELKGPSRGGRAGTLKWSGLILALAFSAIIV